jgi:hypothetical protein
MAVAKKDVVAELRAPFPLDQIYSRQGPGGKALDYVSIETVLQRLLDVAPDYSIDGKVEYINAEDGQAVVSVQLTAGGKTAFGIGEMKNPALDMAVKSATSEAIKNAAKNGFGVALDLWNAQYRDDVKAARKRAGMTEAQLKAQVFKIAIARLGKDKPSAAEIAGLFNVPASKLTDKDTLLEILANEDS